MNNLKKRRWFAHAIANAASAFFHFGKFLPKMFWEPIAQAPVSRLRFVHYFSCEGIGEKAKAIFNNIFGMQFVRNLESVRVNVSEKSLKFKQPDPGGC